MLFSLAAVQWNPGTSVANQVTLRNITVPVSLLVYDSKCYNNGTILDEFHSKQCRQTANKTSSS